MLELIVAALAAYRVSRAVAYERVFRWLHDLIRANDPFEQSPLIYFIGCPLCIGFWLSVLFVVLPDWATYPFAAAGLQVLIQKLDWYIKYTNEANSLITKAKCNTPLSDA